MAVCFRPAPAWRRDSRISIRFAAALGLALTLAGCAGGRMESLGASSLFSNKEQAQQGSVMMFVASTRKGDRGAIGGVDGGARYSLQTVSVPADHKPGEIETPSFGAPNPAKHFTVAARRGVSSENFRNELATHLSGRVGSTRDVLLHVHGFNTSYDEARFRLAQLTTDTGFGGVPVLFTWASKSELLAYGSDKESATVARDPLQRLLLDIAATPGVGRVHILAHSMGTWLTMETLRELAIAGKPDLDGRLGNVMLAAPDIDLSVFRQQVARLDASKVSVFVSKGDRALSLSRTLAGDRPRLGAMNPNDPRDREALDRLGVKVYDLSDLSSGFIGHATYARAPDAVRSIGRQINAPREDSQVQSVLNVAPPEAIAQPTTTAPSASPVTPR